MQYLKPTSLSLSLSLSMYIGLYVTVSGTTVTGDSHYYDVDSRTPKHNLPVLLHRTQEKRPIPFSILPLIETATDFRPIIPSLVHNH